MECLFDSQKLDYVNYLRHYSIILVPNCRGRLIATPVTQHVTLTSPFPDYAMLYVWNITATNRLSGLRITIDDNTPSSEQGPNCHQMRVFLFPGKGLLTTSESVSGRVT